MKQLEQKVISLISGPANETNYGENHSVIQEVQHVSISRKEKACKLMKRHTMIMKDTLTMESFKIMAQKKENYSQKDVKVKQPSNLSISTLFIWKT